MKKETKLLCNKNVMQEPKEKGNYDGEIKIKTRINQKTVKKLYKRFCKINKMLKKMLHLMKKIGK